MGVSHGGGNAACCCRDFHDIRQAIMKDQATAILCHILTILRISIVSGSERVLKKSTVGADGIFGTRQQTRLRLTQSRLSTGCEICLPPQLS